MIAGSVTAGKSRTITEGPQMPTATSQKWNTAWLQSQSVGVAQRTRRNCGREVPTRKAVPTNRKISPMSRMKCWLNGPVVVTPGTAKYQSFGE